MVENLSSSEPVEIPDWRQSLAIEEMRRHIVKLEARHAKLRKAAGRLAEALHEALPERASSPKIDALRERLAEFEAAAKEVT